MPVLKRAAHFRAARDFLNWSASITSSTICLWNGSNVSIFGVFNRMLSIVTLITVETVLILFCSYSRMEFMRSCLSIIFFIFLARWKALLRSSSFLGIWGIFENCAMNVHRILLLFGVIGIVYFIKFK